SRWVPLESSPNHSSQNARTSGVLLRIMNPVCTIPLLGGNPALRYLSICALISAAGALLSLSHASASWYVHILLGWVPVVNPPLCRGRICLIALVRCKFASR